MLHIHPWPILTTVSCKKRNVVRFSRTLPSPKFLLNQVNWCKSIVIHFRVWLQRLRISKYMSRKVFLNSVDNMHWWIDLLVPSRIFFWYFFIFSLEWLTICLQPLCFWGAQLEPTVEDSKSYKLTQFNLKLSKNYPIASKLSWNCVGLLSYTSSVPYKLHVI